MNTKSVMDFDIDRILFSEEQLSEMTRNIAAKIDEDYAVTDGKLLLLGILKGSVVFMGELMKKLKIASEIDFMRVSSYGASSTSSKKINILLDLDRSDLSECNVIIVEDIIDSGRTLSYLVDYLRISGVKSVKTCTLLDKPSRREVDFTPDYVGAEIPDEFVVGYGLDFAEKYRTLPYIGILKREIYEK